MFGPPGSGKTTLIREFQKGFRKTVFVNLDFAQKDSSPFDMLKQSTGVDLERQRVDNGSLVHHAIISKQPICVAIHNAQEKYSEDYFWLLLIRNTCFLNRAVHFIVSAPISCNFSQSETCASLMDFQLRSSLLLNEPDSTMFLTQTYPHGLHNNLKDRNILNVVVDSCKGNLLALRSSIDLLNSHFANSTMPSFSEVLRFCLSDEAILHFQCCFGPLPNPADLKPYRELLLISFYSFIYIGSHDLNKVPTLEKLVYCGILENAHGPYVKCASPLAVRYLSLALLDVGN